jgi:hypothetical protein
MVSNNSMNMMDGKHCNIKQQVTAGGSLVRSATGAAAAVDDGGDYIITAGDLLISFYTTDCVRKDVLT